MLQKILFLFHYFLSLTSFAKSTFSYFYFLILHISLFLLSMHNFSVSFYIQLYVSSFFRYLCRPFIFLFIMEQLLFFPPFFLFPSFFLCVLFLYIVISTDSTFLLFVFFVTYLLLLLVEKELPSLLFQMLCNLLVSKYYLSTAFPPLRSSPSTLPLFPKLPPPC